MIPQGSQVQHEKPVNKRGTKSPRESEPPQVKGGRGGEGGSKKEDCKPLVSLVVPAYNEALLLEQNLDILCQYMESLEDEYRWEIVVVNDGSIDETGEIVQAFASTKENIYVIHHAINLGLGQALQSGFNHCRGDYIVTVDLDLSYSPSHIQKLLTKIRETKAKVVVASPYMEGGKISNVPRFRRTLSIWANRFLSVAAKGHLSTLTGMVRVYDASFLRTLNLKSTGMDINPEVIHKAMLLNARVDEIPAHLHWRHQKAKGGQMRKSSMKILRHSMAVILSGFLFRPVMFFMVPGFVLLLLSFYANAWVLIHCFTNYHELSQFARFPDPTHAVAAAFYEAPHTFIIGGMTLMVAIQLISLGILSLQSKSYFEEIFHLGTTIYRSTREN